MIIYGIGFLTTWVLFSYIMAKYEEDEFDISDSGDLVTIVGIAGIAAIIWPFSLVGVGVGFMVKKLLKR